MIVRAPPQRAAMSLSASFWVSRRFSIKESILAMGICMSKASAPIHSHCAFSSVWGRRFSFHAGG